MELPNSRNIYCVFPATSLTSPDLLPSTGLRIFPDCTLIFPARLLVYTALMLRMEHLCLFEGAFMKLLMETSCTFDDLQVFIAIYLACLKSRIRMRAATHLSDGTYVCIQMPWLIRLLFPLTIRGSAADQEFHRMKNWFNKWIRQTLANFQRMCDFC